MKNILINSPQERLILALDSTGDVAGNISWVTRLQGHVGMFKIGKGTFTRYGPEIVHKSQELGARIFLDLKFHDIPQTVARAAEAAVELGVAMFNVHALGGKAMLREAVSAAGKKAEELERKNPIILAVTVLTSLDADDLDGLGFRSSMEETVLNLARLAQDQGVSGVVASARDILALRKACGPDFIIVTPGIREKDEPADDQKRTATAAEAVKYGADYVVVGRPILLASDPAAAADNLVRDMSRA